MTLPNMSEAVEAGLVDEAHGVIPDGAPPLRFSRMDWKKRAILAEQAADQNAAIARGESMKRHAAEDEARFLRLCLIGAAVFYALLLLGFIRLWVR